MSKFEKTGANFELPQGTDLNRVLIERAAKKCLLGLAILAVVLIVTTVL